MKFSSQLSEATLLKRSFKFMAEVVQDNRQKMMIRCPNIGDIQGCDTLGSRIWYSNAIGYHCLPTWELVEIDGGYLVCVNPEIIKPLVIEGMRLGKIKELQDHTILHAGGQFDQYRSQFILTEHKSQQCYVAIEHVILSNNNGDGFFPSASGDGRNNLHALIQAKEEGHRAILLFCVTNNAITKLKINSDIDPECLRLIRKAQELNIEVIAYKAETSFEGLQLEYSLPILEFAGETTDEANLEQE